MTPDFVRAMRLGTNATPTYVTGLIRLSEIVSVEMWTVMSGDMTMRSLPLAMRMRDGSAWLWRPLLASWAEAEAVLALAAGRCPVHHDPDRDLGASWTCPLCRPELMPWWAEERKESVGTAQP